MVCAEAPRSLKEEGSSRSCQLIFCLFIWGMLGRAGGPAKLPYQPEDTGWLEGPRVGDCAPTTGSWIQTEPASAGWLSACQSWVVGILDSHNPQAQDFGC